MANGLMFVAAKVIDPAVVSDAALNEFYDKERIPQILSSGRSRLALRYRNVDRTGAGADMPYVLLSGVDNLHALNLEDNLSFAEANRVSAILGGRDVYDLIKFDVRPYVKIQTYEGYGNEGRSGEERGRTMICVAMEPKRGEEHDLEGWYRKQHIPMLSMCRNYRRTTRYRHKDGASPRYLALHEFACDAKDLPQDQIAATSATDWSKKIESEAQLIRYDVLELINAIGDTHLNL